MKEFPTNNQRTNQPQAWPPTQGGEGGWGSLQASTAAEASVAERMGFVRKVYALFFIATLFAIGGVALAFFVPSLMIAVAEHPYIAFFVLMGGVIGTQAVRHQPGLNLFALFAFTTLTGVIISPLMYIVGRENPSSIWQAGLMTVGIFGGLTAYVFISKKDFSFLRGMVTTGLIIVFLTAMLNFFVIGSSGLLFATSVAALFLFSGFVLYDTSNIIRRYPTNEYVAGALDLYLDAFNIFLALIRILNAGRR